MELFKDLAERVATTAVFAFLSVFTIEDVSSASAAAVAAGAAALSLMKGFLASRLGDESAGLK